MACSDAAIRPPEAIPAVRDATRVWSECTGHGAAVSSVSASEAAAAAAERLLWLSLARREWRVTSSDDPARRRRRKIGGGDGCRAHTWWPQGAARREATRAARDSE